LAGFCFSEMISSLCRIVMDYIIRTDKYC
jgi:hypothetical protein